MQLDTPVRAKRSKSEESSTRGADDVTMSPQQMELQLQRSNSMEFPDTTRTMEPDETTIDVF